jgi:uncharacterized protein (DUF302 family)
MVNRSGDNGIVNVSSPYSVAETLDRVEAVARSKHMVIFVRIDQRQEAEKVGLSLRPTQLLLFGNPQAGTVLMNASESIAMDLPLKALAWEDSHGQVWLSYNSPEYLKQRHQLTDDQVKSIAGIRAVIEEVVSFGASDKPSNPNWP